MISSAWRKTAGGMVSPRALAVLITREYRVGCSNGRSPGFGIHVVLAEAGTAPEIEHEFTMMAKEHVHATIVLADGFFVQEGRAIADQALKHRLPAVSNNQGFAEAGGLMRYGADLVDNFRRAATYVDKILRGATLCAANMIRFSCGGCD